MMIIIMERSHFIKLTVALYKVSELFPKRDSLRFLIRKKANLILADLVLLNFGSSAAANPRKIFARLINNIEILLVFFEVAKKQHWVNNDNFLVLEKEYILIKEDLDRLSKKQRPKEEKKIPQEVGAKEDSFNNEVLKKRCKKILDVLQEKKIAQVKDLKEFFPEVSKRTLRRDFEYMVGRGFIERVGDSSNTGYRLFSTQ